MKTVNLFDKLPPRRIDHRISRLLAAFERGVFTATQGAEALGISMIDALSIFSYQPISDSRFRISRNSGGFWLLPAQPEMAAAAHWLPLLDPMPRFFSHNTFSAQTGIPHFSANFVLSTLVRAGHLKTGHHSGEYLKPRKRKIVWGPVITNRPRRVIWGN